MLWKRFLSPFAAIAGTGIRYFDSDNMQIDMEKAANRLIKRFMIQNGVPGLSIAVSVNGQNVFTRGFGWADVEQMTPCRETAVMRIASISKPITALLAARLVAAGRLNLDDDIRKYLPDYPKKMFKDKPATITSRQLLSHTSGIRHYHRNPDDKSGGESTEIEAGPEYYSTKAYKTVTEALEMFIKDDLIAAPGEKFEYTTHGFTLLSAVLEKADGRPFLEQLEDLLALLGMNYTRTDTNPDIVAERTRYYRRDKKHILENVPEVDNSYKWAGGGLLSNVEDLVILANAMLYAYQYTSETMPKPIIESASVREMWRPQGVKANKKSYGLGWSIREAKGDHMDGGLPSGRPRFGIFSHGGGAVGASSILLIRPREGAFDDSMKHIPNGITVAVLVNLQDCRGLSALALEISEIFGDLYC